MEKYRRFQDVSLEAADEDVPGGLLSSRDMQPMPLSDIAMVQNNNDPDVTLGTNGSSANGSHLDPSLEGIDGVKFEKNPENGIPQVIITDFRDPSSLPPSGSMAAFKWRLNKIIDHLGFRIFTLVMILLDVVLVIIDLSLNSRNRGFEVTSMCIMTYFMLEILLRLFAKGPRAFVKNWIEIVDGVIVVVSFVFAILPLVMDLGDDVTFLRLLVAGRLIRVVLIIRLVSERKHLAKATRHVVSQNKQRYQQDGFDLDLCYITNRVIAMSFPSTGLMSFYRNPIKDVAKFLDHKHKDHYKIYNLCSERMYDESMFHYQVERIRIDDHNVPTLQDMLLFASNARQWMEADEENVIAVHCKGGKGRTGTMICVWLVESGAFNEAQDSLDYFGDRRTDLTVGRKFQGVETPSQSRYVGYFEEVKKQHNGEAPDEAKIKLKTICVKNLQGIADGNGLDLSCRVITKDVVYMYDFGKQLNCKWEAVKAGSIHVIIEDAPVLAGNVKVMFHSSCKTVPCGYDDCPFYFWFHTSFIDDNRLWLPREELDNPHKKKTWSTFQEGFGVELTFETP